MNDQDPISGEKKWMTPKTAASLYTFAGFALLITAQLINGLGASRMIIWPAIAAAGVCFVLGLIRMCQG